MRVILNAGITVIVNVKAYVTRSLSRISFSSMETVGILAAIFLPHMQYRTRCPVVSIPVSSWFVFEGFRFMFSARTERVMSHCRQHTDVCFHLAVCYVPSPRN
jgi:hypothetical protein